jgi:hypothetical protein
MPLRSPQIKEIVASGAFNVGARLSNKALNPTVDRGRPPAG